VSRESIRARVERNVAPLCQYRHEFKNGRIDSPCGSSEASHRYYVPSNKPHAFTYDPAKDTGDRPRWLALLAVADAAAVALHTDCEDDRCARLADALAALEALP